MTFDANEPSVKGTIIGSEASPKRDLGARPVSFSPPVRHMCKRARIFISLDYLAGSTMQAIMNFMRHECLGPNSFCVLEGRNQIYTCIFIELALEYVRVPSFILSLRFWPRVHDAFRKSNGMWIYLLHSEAQLRCWKV